MRQVFFVLFLLSLSACTDDASPSPTITLQEIAREYLSLELSMSWHDESHVDAYFGPEEVRVTANEAQLSLDDIDAAAIELKSRLQEMVETDSDPVLGMRIAGFIGRLAALHTRIALRRGDRKSFDDESRLLFDAEAPHHDADYFQGILDDIDGLLGGEGALSERVAAFQNQFIIPPDRLASVFDAAIQECRRRTLLYISLPKHESFSIEYVNDKPWSGYNWYQGDAQSLIQINTDLPIFIDRAVDLGCHEGYPGHHTFNALLEKNLVQDKGWLEFSLYPLFSPQSLIAEGSGNYGIELAFPNGERIEFERNVLFPLAGLDATQADSYYELLVLLGRLEYAGNEAARDYLNGDIDREEAVQWLVDYTLTSPERARQRTDFFDTYRSYVINYNLGEDIVRDYIERDDANLTQRWGRFEELLSSPMTASDLK